MSKVQLFVVGAVFDTSILNSASFQFFFAHVELEKEPFAAWNQALWLCKGRSKTTTVCMDRLSNQEKIYLFIFVKPQPVSLLIKLTDDGVLNSGGCI